MTGPALLDHDAISRLIPHAGDMCLLDCVLSWDPSSIRCVSRRHRAANNPLILAGRLGSLSGIEFALQAMAVHGGLAGMICGRPQAGYLVSLRHVECRCDQLDSFHNDLMVNATLLVSDEKRVMYSFAITCDGEDLITGRATVMLEIEGP